VKVGVTCPCGQGFEADARRVAVGRGRYCSKACFYTYRTRPSGLTYEIKVTNRAWFSPGQAPHNAGTATPRPRKGRRTGPSHHAWKGDEVGYDALHDWVRRYRDQPDACEHCGKTDKPLDWANKSGEYRRDLTDWLALCRSCHKRYDLARLGAAACA